MSEAPGKFDQHTANIGKIWNSAVSLAGTLTLMAFSPPWELQQLLLLLTIVVVLTAIVTFISYRLTRTNQVYRTRIRRIVLWGIIIVGVIYVVGYHRYTFRNGHGELCAKGYTLTPWMDRAINGPSDHVKPEPGIPANLKDMPEHQRLEEVCGFDARKYWTEDSIKTVEEILLGLWLAVVALLIYFIGMFAASDYLR